MAKNLIDDLSLASLAFQKARGQHINEFDSSPLVYETSVEPVVRAIKTMNSLINSVQKDVQLVVRPIRYGFRATIEGSFSGKNKHKIPSDMRVLEMCASADMSVSYSYSGKNGTPSQQGGLINATPLTVLNQYSHWMRSVVDFNTLTVAQRALKLSQETGGTQPK